MLLRNLRDQIAEQLHEQYERREAVNIANLILQELTGVVPADFGWRHATDVSLRQPPVSEFVKRLRKGEPVQHLLGKVYFDDLVLNVSSDVLIPRPETEELVYHIRKKYEKRPKPVHVLDVGTGSGCIILSLAKAGIGTHFWAWEKSEAALAIAQKNAQDHGLDIHWIHDDFLRPQKKNVLPAFDLVVSNPPYIPEQERPRLARQVRDFEPESALFVPGNRPILFYEHLARWAQSGGMTRGGRLFVELHPDYAQQTETCWVQAGLQKCFIKKDLQGKWRYLEALR